MSLRRLNDISVRVLTLPASHNDTDHERCMINTLFALNKGVEAIDRNIWIDWSRYPSMIKV